MTLEETRTRRGNRRWFLGVTGTAAGAATLAAVGCTDRSNPPASPGPVSPTDGPDDSPAVAPTTARQDGQRGETLRYTGYIAWDGTADPHKTQAGPFFGQQSLVFSRLLSYESQITARAQPDLALGMPEQPDGQTLTFRLNSNARWHDVDPVRGRPVTSNDVRHSIERQLNGDASFVRKYQWTNIDAIETPDPATVTFKFKQPMAQMVSLFADVNAFIVPPELTENGRRWDISGQVGSGPFAWVEWSDGKFASAVRNPRWHGGNGRPYLDGVTVQQPRDTAEVEGDLRTKNLDFAFVGRPQADRLRKVLPALNEYKSGQSLFFGMRFFVASPPFDDTRLRSALTIAIDRHDMIRQFFGGSGGVNPWISWPMTRWSLPQAELSNQPGYRPGAGGRAEDIKDAKALLAAYTAEKALPENLELLVLDDAERNLRMGSVMRDHIRDALGLNVTLVPVALNDLVNRLLTGNAPWAAGPDTGWVDLDDWVFPYFHSTGTKNSFPIRNPDLDALIEAQRVQLDEGQRREISFDIQRKLLGINCGVNLVSEEVVALGWPYVKNFPLDAADGYQHRFADTWIDRSDPSFRGR